MIFISYRREDSAYIVDRIFERLQRQYGKHAVFMDVDSIGGGKDFRRVLDDCLYKADVLLAVIGKRWIRVKDDSGKRRLDKEDDFVRAEILTAFDRGIPVIPLIIDEAEMPTTGELPPALQDLAFRNFIKIRPNRDFDPDMKFLMDTLRDSWCIRPDSWWRVSVRLVSSKTSRKDRSPAPSTHAGPSPARTPPNSSDSRPVGINPSVDESLIERVRRIHGEPALATGDSSVLRVWTKVTKCYIRSGTRVTGPFNEDQLRSMRGRGEIAPTHEVSIDRVRWESAEGLVRMLDGAKVNPGRAQQPTAFWEEAAEAPPSRVTNHSPQPQAAPEPPQWYYAESNREQGGPISEEDLIELLQTRRLSRGTLVCKVGETKWEPVSRQPVLAPFAARGNGAMVALVVFATLFLGMMAVLLVVRLSR